ncbi:hypothetical protein [Stenomitos frigidus]|uniref:Uncharacterized protein n=1 Tax=Stenomitos frigidus ULC18 TaxID=2107698 RepID=A0A2T1ES50_9CYAN|nr:hypothetical protein [Stenomitos frigidus]PSB35557.1 hypothetical protein C7B82_00745 [Stenomitos frigidus ULC18]
MAIFEWIFLIGFGVLGGVAVTNVIQSRQQQSRLEQAFYQLLEVENGNVSLIQLAATARVKAALAKSYLDTQVKFFGAVPEVDDDGDEFYRFPKLRRWSEPEEWQ